MSSSPFRLLRLGLPLVGRLAGVQVKSQPLGPLQTLLRNSSTEVNYIRTTMTQLKASDGISLQITGSNEYGFIINNNIKALGPIVIFPKTIFSWNVSGIDDINENSLKLFELLDPKIDILIIGTGENNMKNSAQLAKWLISNKINNFEILPTEKAINAFNFLVVENRFVAAAMLPSAPVVYTDPSVKRVFDRAELLKETSEDLTIGHIKEGVRKAKLLEEDEKRKK